MFNDVDTMQIPKDIILLPPFTMRKEGCRDSAKSNDKVGHRHGVVPSVTKLCGLGSSRQFVSWRLITYHSAVVSMVTTSHVLAAVGERTDERSFNPHPIPRDL